MPTELPGGNGDTRARVEVHTWQLAQILDDLHELKDALKANVLAIEGLRVDIALRNEECATHRVQIKQLQEASRTRAAPSLALPGLGALLAGLGTLLAALGVAIKTWLDGGHAP